MDSYRILFFISSLISGGAENHLLNLCLYLKSVSHFPVVCVVSSRERGAGDGLRKGLEDEFLSYDIPLIELELSSLRDLLNPSNVFYLKKIVRQNKPDLIHAHLYHAEVVASIASFLTGVPVVTTRHSSGLEFERSRRWIIRSLGSRFEKVIAVSGNAALEAVRAMGRPGGRVVTVPNGIDTLRFHPIDEPERKRRRTELLGNVFPGGAPESSLLVGSVGGLKPVKNHEAFIRMAAELVGEEQGGPDGLRFMIFGEGSERNSLANLADRLGIRPLLAMPGHADRPEEVYPLLDVFVLTSVVEGVPMALLEAMASGVACAARDVGGVGEVIGDAGRLVSGAGVGAAVDAVKFLLNNEKERKELGRRARLRVMERYDLDTWGGRILDIYREVVEKRRRA